MESGSSEDSSFVVSTQTGGQQPALYNSLQNALFANREKLLDFFSSDTPVESICVPVALDSYEQFHHTVNQRLEQLWYIQRHASQGLSKTTTARIERCVRILEQFWGNPDLWRSSVTAPDDPKD